MAASLTINCYYRDIHNDFVFQIIIDETDYGLKIMLNENNIKTLIQDDNVQRLIRTIPNQKIEYMKNSDLHNLINLILRTTPNINKIFTVWREIVSIQCYQGEDPNTGIQKYHVIENNYANFVSTHQINCPAADHSNRVVYVYITMPDYKTGGKRKSRKRRSRRTKRKTRK